MATTVAELLATLGLDASDFNKEIDQAESKGSGFGNTMSKLSTIGAGVLAAGFTTAAAGAALLGKELFTDIGIASDAQKVQSQLEAVLKSTGGVAGITSEKANELAESLASVTAFDDEAIKSGESMLLTFTNIGKEVFPAATETILDMSQALGQDLQSSAIQLGKALNDPVAGITALQRVGVSFTDEQKKVVEAMVASGDVMGAQNFILKELATEFGGSAKAAGTTFAGQVTIAKNKIDNMRESVGAKLLPILGNLASMLTDQLMKPETQKFIDDLGTSIANLAQKAVEGIPKLIEGFQTFSTWLQNNKPIVIGVLAALGVALLAFGITSAIAAATAIAPFLPVIAILAGVGIAVALLAKAWESNFLGIKTRTMAIVDFVKKSFEGWKLLFTVIIPNAIASLKAKWTAGFDGIRAAIQKVVDFIQKLKDKLMNLILPDWLTPGSPTPFELGLLGISKALDSVNSKSFSPDLSMKNMNLPSSSALNSDKATSDKPVIYNVEINNPQGEPTEDSVRKALNKSRKLSYLGVPS